LTIPFGGVPVSVRPLRGFFFASRGGVFRLAPLGSPKEKEKELRRKRKRILKKKRKKKKNSSYRLHIYCLSYLFFFLSYSFGSPHTSP